MKKQLLLTAAAVSVLALTGTAQAGEIINKRVGNVTTLGADEAYTLANEVDLTPALVFAKANNEVTLDPTTGDLPAGTYVFSFDLTGADFVTTSVTSADLQVTTSQDAGTPGTCTTGSPVVSTLSDSTISFIVTANDGCTGDGEGIQSVTLDFGFEVAAANAVSITGTITSGGNPVDGGPSDAAQLVAFADGFQVEVTPDSVEPEASLTSDFQTFQAGQDGNLGEVYVGPIVYATDTVYSNTSGTAVNQADVTEVLIELTGSTAGLTFDVNGTAPDNMTSPLEFDPALAGNGIYVVDADPNTTNTTPIRASDYSVDVVYELDAAFTGPVDSPANDQDLASITREGTNVLIPWVASGTLAANSQSETVIRISNIGTDATGAVSAELLTSSNNAETGEIFPLNGGAGIPAGGELVITSGAFEDGVFGTDFGRADINLTIEAEASDIIIRRFIRNTVNNVLTEVSLGRDAGGNEPQN